MCRGTRNACPVQTARSKPPATTRHPWVRPQRWSHSRLLRASSRTATHLCRGRGTGRQTSRRPLRVAATVRVRDPRIAQWTRAISRRCRRPSARRTAATASAPRSGRTIRRQAIGAHRADRDRRMSCAHHGSRRIGRLQSALLPCARAGTSNKCRSPRVPITALSRTVPADEYGAYETSRSDIAYGG